MKTSALTFGIALAGFILLFASSCKKTTEDLIDKAPTSVSVTLNSTFWKTENVKTDTVNGMYVITATKDKEQMVFTMPKMEKGEYPVLQNGTTITYIKDTSNPTDAYIAASGKIKVNGVIEDGKEFEGEFDFVAANASADVIMATNGSLVNIPIPK